MAGDPYYDTTATTVYQDGQRWYDTTTSGYYTIVHISMSEMQESLEKKIKEFIRKAAIQKMKDDWRPDSRHMKPMPLLRPTHRLQNICFNGRGWAK